MSVGGECAQVAVHQFFGTVPVILRRLFRIIILTDPDVPGPEDFLVFEYGNQGVSVDSSRRKDDLVAVQHHVVDDFCLFGRYQCRFTFPKDRDGVGCGEALVAVSLDVAAELPSAVAGHDIAVGRLLGAQIAAYRHFAGGADPFVQNDGDGGGAGVQRRDDTVPVYGYDVFPVGLPLRIVPKAMFGGGGERKRRVPAGQQGVIVPVKGDRPGDVVRILLADKSLEAAIVLSVDAYLVIRDAKQRHFRSVADGNPVGAALMELLAFQQEATHILAAVHLVIGDAMPPVALIVVAFPQIEIHITVTMPVFIDFRPFPGKVAGENGVYGRFRTGEEGEQKGESRQGVGQILHSLVFYSIIQRTAFPQAFPQ